MKPIIKKPEFRALKKSVVSQSLPEELYAVDTAATAEIEQQQPPEEIPHPATEYPAYQSSAQSYPVLQSVGNTGWQVSDIWRDLRVDSFSNL
ncbi:MULTISPECIES: hypothetical protein [Nostoc]|uniref:Uncharacterized protein n=1 Tax=Nostoc paludosum FACHB-159 TaxID=2692908 RepID=A0ABR8KIK7_9NOSO|nr:MULTISPECIES: hypothetical protein [Nostoc]MBD2683069.1 hypothetical protein [Nostoc sp. FACHB-857]MBD2739399.1 hypothetical protein [Nostoc paludosum FACHB-159]